MLVLSRRQNESVLIQEDIVVEVLEIRGNRVRLGIRAPEYVRVVRAEISQRGRNSDDCALTDDRDQTDWGSVEIPVASSEPRTSREWGRCRIEPDEPGNAAEPVNNEEPVHNGSRTIRETVAAYGITKLAQRAVA